MDGQYFGSKFFLRFHDQQLGIFSPCLSRLNMYIPFQFTSTTKHVCCWLLTVVFRSPLISSFTFDTAKLISTSHNLMHSCKFWCSQILVRHTWGTPYGFSEEVRQFLVSSSKLKKLLNYLQSLSIWGLLHPVPEAYGQITSKYGFSYGYRS